MGVSDTTMSKMSAIGVARHRPGSCFSCTKLLNDLLLHVCFIPAMMMIDDDDDEDDDNDTRL